MSGKTQEKMTDTDAEEVEKMSPETTGTQGVVALVTSPEEVKGFKWTKKKRKAVQLVIRGYKDSRIGEELGVSRRTIIRWRKSSEFLQAIAKEAHEYSNRTRLKRVFETGVLTDQFSAQMAKTFKALNKKKVPTQQQLNALQLMAREYREFREQERADFGDNIKRFEGSFQMSLTPTGSAQTSGSKGSQNFKSFVEANADKISKRIIEGSKTPQEALTEATVELLQETTLLDEMFEEEKAAAEAAKKAK